MATHDIALMGAVYPAVPQVILPVDGGGTATFTDVSDTTAEASDVASGMFFYNSLGERLEGLLMDAIRAVPLEWEQGDINSSGANTTSTTTVRTQYIPTTPGEQFIKYNVSTGKYTTNYCHFYSANKTFIERNHTNIAPANAAYMRTTFQGDFTTCKNIIIVRTPNALSIEEGGRALYWQTSTSKTLDIDVPAAAGDRYFFLPIEWGGPTATAISLSGKNSNGTYTSLGSVSGVWDFKAFDIASAYTGFRVTVTSSTPASSVSLMVIFLKVGTDKLSTIAYAFARRFEQMGT